MNKFFIRKEAGLVKEADYRANTLRRIFGPGKLLPNAWKAWSRYLNTTKRFASRQYNKLSKLLDSRNAAATSPDAIRHELHSRSAFELWPSDMKQALWDALEAKGRTAYERGANYLLDDFHKLNAQIPGKITGLFKNPAKIFSIPAKLKQLTTGAANLNKANLITATPRSGGRAVIDRSLPRYKVSDKYDINMTPGLVLRSDFDDIFKGLPEPKYVTSKYNIPDSAYSKYHDAGKALKKEYDDIFDRRNGFQRPE